jgi:Putative phage replication protein RstA
MATLRIDYLVATYDLAAVEAHLPAIAGAVIRQPEHGKHLGYRGYWCAESRRAFVGDDSNRVMVSVTSSPAHAAALALPRLDTLSIARIDVQTTLISRDADALISACEPSPRYQAFRIAPVRGRGHTLYVGSPKSDKRLRVYNKSAESGQSPTEGEYVRFELQLRDDYAERAFTALRGGGLAGWYLHALKAMIDPYTFSVVRDAINDVDEYHDDEIAREDWVQRRIVWVERSVIPALKKLFAQRPDYLDIVIKMLYDATKQ